MDVLAQSPGSWILPPETHFPASAAEDHLLALKQLYKINIPDKSLQEKDCSFCLCPVSESILSLNVLPQNPYRRPVRLRIVKGAV